MMAPDRQIDDATNKRRPLRPPLTALIAALLLVGGILGARWLGGAAESGETFADPVNRPVANAGDSPSAVVPASDESPARLSPEEQRRRKLLGSWRDQYYGERTMTFRDDGKGTMVIKLTDPVGKTLYGDQLKFDLTWEDRDGVLVMQFTGGEPKSAVAAISKLFGDRHEQRIEELTETDLHLRSTDSGNLYTLKRVED